MQTLRMIMLAATGIMAAAQARAETAPVIVEAGMPTKVVSYADLDLTSAAGRLALDRRVVSAASDLCLDRQRTPLAEAIAQHRCYSTALSQARIDIRQAVARAGAQLALQGSIRVAAK